MKTNPAANYPAANFSWSDEYCKAESALSYVKRINYLSAECQSAKIDELVSQYSILVEQTNRSCV